MALTLQEQTKRSDITFGVLDMEYPDTETIYLSPLEFIDLLNKGGCGLRYGRWYRALGLEHRAIYKCREIVTISKVPIQEDM